MTKREKKRFVRDLTESVVQHFDNNVDKMPDEWDGHELRQWLADQFILNVMINRVMKGKRLREYRNVCATEPIN